MKDLLSDIDVRMKDYEVSLTQLDSVKSGHSRIIQGKASEIFSGHKIVTDKKQLSVYSSAIFGSKGTRSDDNVTHFHNLALIDYDDLPSSSCEQIQRLFEGTAHIYYTTFKHSGNGPSRFRIAVFFDRPIELLQYKKIIAFFLRKSGGTADPSCSALSSCFFEAGTNKENYPFAEIRFNDGKLISYEKCLTAVANDEKELFIAFKSKARVFMKGQKKTSPKLPYCKFINILNCCPALKALAYKATKTQLGFYEGWALVSYLQYFEEAIERFSKRSVGWGKTERDLTEIEKFIKKQLAPYSCSTLQTYKICGFACPTHCMERIGDKEPSPIRFAKYPFNTKLHLEQFLSSQDN